MITLQRSPGDKSTGEAGLKSAAPCAHAVKPASRTCARDHLNRIHESLSAASWGVDCMITRVQGAGALCHSGQSSRVSRAGRHTGAARYCGHVCGGAVDRSLQGKGDRPRDLYNSGRAPLAARVRMCRAAEGSTCESYPEPCRRMRGEQ